MKPRNRRVSRYQPPFRYRNLLPDDFGGVGYSSATTIPQRRCIAMLWSTRLIVDKNGVVVMRLHGDSPADFVAQMNRTVKRLRRERRRRLSSNRAGVTVMAGINTLMDFEYDRYGLVSTMREDLPPENGHLLDIQLTRQIFAFAGFPDFDMNCRGILYESSAPISSDYPVCLRCRRRFARAVLAIALRYGLSA